MAPKIVNLHGEDDGIRIALDAHGDFVMPPPRDADPMHVEAAAVHVIGHRLYACPIKEAHEKIRAEYLSRAGRSARSY